MDREEYEELSNELTTIIYSPTSTLGEKLNAWAKWCKLFDLQIETQEHCISESAEYRL